MEVLSLHPANRATCGNAAAACTESKSENCRGCRLTTLAAAEGIGFNPMLYLIRENSFLAVGLEASPA
jgi:hypothetical protein